jgi:hypothetical protein
MTTPRLRRRRAVCAVASALVLLLATTVGMRSHHRDPRPPEAATFAAASQAPPLALPPQDVARPVPAASRSTIRTHGPHLVPAAVGKSPECKLTLPAGVWSLDVTAARALTMITAGSYRDNVPVTKAALAFEHAMNERRYRSVPTTFDARMMLRRKYHHLPRTWTLDAVLALYQPQTLTCVTPIRTVPREDMLTNGLTMRAQTMLFAFWAAYGGRPIGGFAPGGITTGHIENSAHYEGRAIDVSFPTNDPDNNRRGWLLAQWLVAQADYLQIATVIFDDHLWTRMRSAEGWRPYTHPSGNITDPTLRHLNHVHVDVAHGFPEGNPVLGPLADVGAIGRPETHAVPQAPAGPPAPVGRAPAPAAPAPAAPGPAVPTGPGVPQLIPGLPHGGTLPTGPSVR